MKAILERNFLFLIPLLFTFPLFKESISSLFFILLALNTIVYQFIIKFAKKPDLLRVFILSLPFWVILMSSVLKSTLIENLGNINHALFFLLFPLLFAYVPNQYFTAKKLTFYFWILKLACAIIAVGYLVAYFATHPASEFFKVQNDVSSFRNYIYWKIPFFKIHPTYYTTILLFCVAESMDNILIKRKLVQIIFVILFLAITFLLLVKVNIILMLILIPSMILFRSKIRSKVKNAIVVSFAAVMVLFVMLTPGITDRFREFYDNYNKPPAGVAHNSTNIRISIFNCTAQIAEENYLFGVGFENLGNELQACFAANYDSEFYKSHQFLTHNYFAYMFLSAGIIGLLSMLFYTAYVGRIVYSINAFALYVVAINVLIICFTEDYFYRHFGLFFFSLMLFSYIKFANAKKINS